MDFIKLPENSEKLLLELIQADNPVQMLGVRFEQASQRDDDELRGMLRELRERGYINVQWADNVPYYLTLTNSARTYREQLAEYEAQKTAHFSQKKKVSPIIFISHRSTDKAIADMLLDFFSGTGIPRETVFCSSLPGNDINEKISGEVKTALKKSVVNIAILSTDYYQSAYCLNEAGILWYQDDVPVIPIALPEINSSNMYGFLSNEYKLRRLDSDTDIPYIYDVVSEAVSAPRTKVGIITHESAKLKGRYADFLKTRESQTFEPSVMLSSDRLEITTDDETVVLLSKLNAKQHIEVELNLDELDLTAAESKATYEEIKAYVLEHTGLKVSHLYIAQVKQKYGIIERENYNKPKSENAKQPKCPPEKEAAIMDALKHFHMV